MGAKNQTGTRKTFFSLKAKTSDSDPTPYIGRQEKGDAGWHIAEKFNAIEGRLVSIAHSSYEYQGEQKTKIIIGLDDGNEEMSLEGNFNSLVYSILNSLAGTNNLGNIEINVWLSKELVNGKNFPKCAVKNDGDKTTWKYDWNNVPKAKDVKVGNKTYKDDSDVVEFWKKEVEGIAARIKVAAPAETSQPTNEPESVMQKDDDFLADLDKDSGDLLPF